LTWWQRIFNRKTASFEEDGFIQLYSTVLASTPQFNEYQSDREKLEVIFKSHSLLKVFCLQCDLFSIGKVIVKDKAGQIIDNDPFLNLIKNPNPFQSQSQFLWDYMFWTMIGNSYCYVDSDVISENNKLYFLDHQKMNFPQSVINMQDKLIFSKNSLKNINDAFVTYRYADSTEINLPFSKININNDISNGNGNWFKGNSRIDSLYKIISNAEETLDAENINTRYTGKFLVAGTNDPNDVTKTPMSEEEKLSIEQKVNGSKQVHAVKSMIEIKRFVENMRNLELGKSYLEKFFLIGSMFNIPKDVLEANANGATYENQEKSTAKHISYTLQPKGNDFFESLAKRFGYDKQGKTITIDWSHLPFMQVFEKDRVSTQQTKINTLTSMLKLGIDLKEINDFLGTDFKKAIYEQPKKIDSGGN
jgi:hypothetical protein